MRITATEGFRELWYINVRVFTSMIYVGLINMLEGKGELSGRYHLDAPFSHPKLCYLTSNQTMILLVQDVLAEPVFINYRP